MPHTHNHSTLERRTTKNPSWKLYAPTLICMKFKKQRKNIRIGMIIRRKLRKKDFEREGDTQIHCCNALNQRCKKTQLIYAFLFALMMMIVWWCWCGIVCVHQPLMIFISFYRLKIRNDIENKLNRFAFHATLDFKLSLSAFYKCVCGINRVCFALYHLHSF